MAVIVGVVATLLAAFGMHLLYTAVVYRWRGIGIGPSHASRPGWRTRARRTESRPGELRSAGLAATAGAGLGGAMGFALFGGAIAAVMAAAFGAAIPLLAAKDRQRRRAERAADSWPRLLEELRTLTGASGRSIPTALFEVGRRSPVELRGAFERAERHWLLTTDFSRTLAVLKEELADPTADTICETLAVAHDVGGGGLDRRLAELVEDRIVDREGRRDAHSKQAGVRFARLFVLLVPLGMAAAGLTIGSGRAAYETPGGQIAVGVGLVAVIACWVWSGSLMRLPAEPRVFAGSQELPGPAAASTDRAAG